MSDHTLPTTASNYSTLLTEISNRIIDAMKFARSDLVTITANLITTGYIRFNTTTHQFEEDTSVTTTKTWAPIIVNATTVTTNANLTGVVTSVGNATSFAASPTFTGTPITTTAAVDTNTTQIASTAYVIGQGYLKAATASSTYAPLASPTFTGSPNLAAASASSLSVLSNVIVKNGSVGYTVLTSGNAGNSGYIEFYSAAGVRQGYIGFSNTTATADTGTVPYIAGVHSFTGSGSFSSTLSATQFTGPATALKSATTSVDVSAATAPVVGQALVATDSTHATWQTISGVPDFLLLNAGIL